MNATLPLRVSAGMSRLKGRGSRILASMAAMKHNSSSARIIMVGVVVVPSRFLLIGVEFLPGAFKPDATPLPTRRRVTQRARAFVRRTLPWLQFLRTDQGEIDARLTNIQASLMVNSLAVDAITVLIFFQVVKTNVGLESTYVDLSMTHLIKSQSIPEQGVTFSS